MSHITLYEYWRSSAAYRVRIVLALKQLRYESVAVHLVNNHGEQHSDAYKAINPSELVPTLIDGDMKLSQSLAIIDYLDETYPRHKLIPESGHLRYLVKSLAQDIAVDIHPINNLRVMQYLGNKLSANEQQKLAWTQHWITLGFSSLEQKIQALKANNTALESNTPKAGNDSFCVGNTLSLVDVCLIPQVYNAQRFGVTMSQFPSLDKVSQSLNKHPAFITAAPENQSDANM